METLFDHAKANPSGYRDIDPASVAKVAGRIHIVDVREPHERHQELGYVRESELVPLATVEAAARKWSKDDELVLVCRSGGRSGRAAAALASAGFRRVMNMEGGMLAWNDAHLPVAR